jgi:hypothetical protein
VGDEWLDLVGLFIERGTDIRAEGDLALIGAVGNGNIEVVKLLLATAEGTSGKGANVHAKK